MARRRSSSRAISARPISGRGHYTTARVILPRSVTYSSILPQAISRPLQIAQRSGVDARLFSPVPRQRRLFYSVSGYPATVRTRVKSGSLYGQSYFTVPRSVAVCVRRSQRREVMFASQRAGRGRRVYNRRSRRNASSSISCK